MDLQISCARSQVPSMVEVTSKRTVQAFRVITATFLLLVMVILIFGLMHKSSQPQILNRYSLPYALLLAGLSVIAIYLSWVSWKAGPRAVRWTANIFLFLFSTVLVLLIVEWGMRIFNPFGVRLFHDLPYHMQGMVDHPVLGYKHPASVKYVLGNNLVELNSRGLRDKEIPLEKPSDEKRILVLGDSVTFGWGISQGETFSDHMESLLQERTEDSWQVINAGVNGYNTEQEASYLRIEGMDYSPDVVLLVYVRNDVDRALNPNSTTWRRHPAWPSSLPEALGRLRQHSFLFQSSRLFTRMYIMDSARAAVTVGDETILIEDQNSITRHARWPRSKKALLDIAQICRKNDIPFLVAIASGWDEALVTELGDAGIEAMHLRPAYKGVSQKLAYVSRIDPHPSALLHEKMAIYLVDALQKRGWLDR